LNPDFAERCRDQADALLAQGRFEEAIAGYDQLIALRPDDARAYNNHGKVLKNLERFAEALDSYDRAITLLPDRAEIHSNRGNVLYELERFQEAIESFDVAIRLNPDYAEATWNKALLCLLLGRFNEGWRCYEARKRKKDPAGNRQFDKPLWLGDRDISGKTLLVHWEQGYGDVIQFSRYVSLCQRAGARVLLAPQKPLQPLMLGLHAKARIVDLESDFLLFDYHCPIMSLPLAFRTELTNIPRESYLSADEVKVAAWAARLGKKTRPRIGVVWGSKDPPSKARIIPLERFRQLLSPSYEFVSLQKHLAEVERACLDGLNVRHLEEELVDFSDTAAICHSMDLVISIDTSVAHLAGALELPVWVLLPRVPEWRWMLNRDDSPWYPSMRLFRQQMRDDWEGVFERVRRELHTMFG
jgi:tetratricopeptide (TPR) repeat protein